MLASVKLYYNLTQLVLYIKISNADLLSMLVITLAVSFLSGYVLYSDNDRVCINIITVYLINKPETNRLCNN